MGKEHSCLVAMILMGQVCKGQSQTFFCDGPDMEAACIAAADCVADARSLCLEKDEKCFDKAVLSAGECFHCLEALHSGHPIIVGGFCTFCVLKALEYETCRSEQTGNMMLDVLRCNLDNCPAFGDPPYRVNIEVNGLCEGESLQLLTNCTGNGIGSNSAVFVNFQNNSADAFCENGETLIVSAPTPASILEVLTNAHIRPIPDVQHGAIIASVPPPAFNEPFGSDGLQEVTLVLDVIPPGGCPQPGVEMLMLANGLDADEYIRLEVAYTSADGGGNSTFGTEEVEFLGSHNQANPFRTGLRAERGTQYPVIEILEKPDGKNCEVKSNSCMGEYQITETFSYDYSINEQTVACINCVCEDSNNQDAKSDSYYPVTVHGFFEQESMNGGRYEGCIDVKLKRGWTRECLDEVGSVQFVSRDADAGEKTFGTLIQDGQYFQLTASPSNDDTRVARVSLGGIQQATGSIGTVEATGTVFRRFNNEDRCAIVPETCINHDPVCLRPNSLWDGVFFQHFSCPESGVTCATGFCPGGGPPVDPDDVCCQLQGCRLTFEGSFSCTGSVAAAASSAGTGTPTSGVASQNAVVYSRVDTLVGGQEPVIEYVDNELAVVGVARCDASPISNLRFYLDGVEVTLDGLLLDQYDEWTCDELPGANCNPYSRFSGILDTSALSEGEHDFVVAAIPDPGMEIAIAYGIYRFGVEHSGSSNSCDTDITKPNVDILSPANGSVLQQGLVNIEVDATDANGIDRVRFIIDGTTVATEYEPPYAYDWIADPGGHRISIRAFDTCGNNKLKRSNVTVASGGPCAGDIDGPSVRVDLPAANGAAAGTFSIEASASDPSGIAFVEFLVDEVALGIDDSAPYSMNWVATAGDFTLEARAMDNCGNDSSVERTVTIGTGDPCDEDATLPSVYFISPVSGAVLSAGAVTIEAGAGDANGIESVKFLVDFAVKHTDNVAPYEFDWSATPGIHRLGILATDGCDNSRLTQIDVTVEEASPCGSSTSGPVLSFTSPSDGANLSPGNVTIEASATDANGVNFVQFFVDNVYKATDYSSPYSYDWNADPGSHTLQIAAVNGCDNSSTATIDVEVQNSTQDPCGTDTQKPSVSLTSPEDGDVFNNPDTIDITVTASDANGINRVELYIDGVLQDTDPTSPYEFTWSASPGDFALRAKAVDTCNNVKWTPYIDTTVTEPAVDLCDDDFDDPSVSISAPANSAVLEPGTIAITANASDATNVVGRVEFFVDGVYKGTDYAAPYKYEWDASAASGAYTLSAKAYDVCERSRTTQITVTVQPDPCLNDSDEPTVSLSGIPAVVRLDDTVRLTANVTDPAGASKAEFYIAGNLMHTDNEAPFIYDWLVVNLGPQTVQARGFDSCNNDALSQSITVSPTLPDPDINPE